MSREIGNVLVFIANKEKGSAWLPTVDSIHYPGTAAFSYIINRSWGMVEILLIAHGCIVLIFINCRISIFLYNMKKDQCGPFSFLFSF